MNYKEFALTEFKRLGLKPIEECGEEPDKWIQENVLELLEVFSKQGHSGFSAPNCIQIFSKLALFKPLSPITDDDWNLVTDNLYQHKRMSNVFKEFDRVYRSDGIVMRDPKGITYTNQFSKLTITLPYIECEPVILDVNDEGDFATLDYKNWIPIENAVNLIQDSMNKK